MKKILSTILTAALLVGTFALGAISASAATLELQPADKAQYGQLTSTGGCGFIDGNLYFTTNLNVDKATDVKVEVNGKPAYWNDGYLGLKHGGLGLANDLEKSWLQIGIVGADLNVGENTLKITAGGDTYTHTFTSTAKALGVSYSKVVTDVNAKTTKAEIVFNTDPKLAVGTTLIGTAHDDHNGSGRNGGNMVDSFKVTKYDAATKMYTIEGDFTTNFSLLELQINDEKAGDNNGAFITATINTKTGTFIGDKKITEESTKVTITEVTANRGDGAKLIDGTNSKLECAVPSESDPVTITFKTADAVKPDYLVIYTGDDDSRWANRAPNAFKLYGVSGETETLLLEKTESGMQNVDFTPFAFDVDNDTAYDTFKLVITSRISLELLPGQSSNEWFQIGEIELYTGKVDVTENDRYDTVTGAVEYNGTAPKADEGNKGGETGDKTKPAPTGDIAVALSAVALIAVAGAVVIAKKRKIEE